MEKKWIIIIIIIGSIGIVAAGMILFQYARAYSTVTSPDESAGCQILKENGLPQERINIVFLSTEKMAEELITDFFNTAPYSLNEEKFNIYYIPPEIYHPECDLYQGKALYCYSRSLVKEASICPYDVIVAVEEMSSHIRSSTYNGVMSINAANLKKVFVHEFGHAFVNLADEYVPAELPKSAKNCVESCNDFGGSSCFQGCSENSLQRSIDNGIMRTLRSNEFGDFDEGLIQERIDEVIDERAVQTSVTGNAISPQGEYCQGEYYVLLQGNYAEGSLDITKKTVEPGCLGKEGLGDYTYQLTMQDGSSYTKGGFNPGIIFIESQEPFEEEINGETQRYEGTFFLKVPLVQNSETLTIEDYEGNTVAEVDMELNHIIGEVKNAQSGSRPCML